MTLNLNLDLPSGKSETGLDPETLYDTLIVGGGPAGLNAALYAKRKGLKVGILAGRLGGQVADTSTVENYLGFESLSGDALMKKFETHVNAYKIPMAAGVSATGIHPGEGSHEVATDNGNIYRARTLILATGNKPRQLKVPGESALIGKGVSYCAICDGPFFAGKTVVVAGGGNSAVEAAIDLAKIADKVILVHRSRFRADQILTDRLEALENVDIRLQTAILSLKGSPFLESVEVLDKETGVLSTIEADGLFVEIGHIPQTGLFKDLVALNEKGEIRVDRKGATSLPGVFAAGDATDSPYKQIVLSAAAGAQAALGANDYLTLQGH